MSVLTHGYNLEITNIPINNCCKNIDKLVAHFTFCYVVFNDTPKIIEIQPLIITFPFLLLNIWVLEHVYPKNFILLHSIFHLISITTLHLHLYYFNLLNFE